MLTLFATPTWNDLPALIREAEAVVDDELQACSKKPLRIGISVTRDPKTGKTSVGRPVPGVGYLGYTELDKCAGKAAAKIVLPVLPAMVERLGIAVPLAASDPAWADWRDLPAALAAVIATGPLGACDVKARTVRLVLDLRHGKTRVWLPAWQFHAESGDGTTPVPEQKVKACLGKAIAGWNPPVLPRDLGEIEVAVAVKPHP